jgi:hypothetical protein
MARGRLPILLLVALAALFVLPAAALAQDTNPPSNDTPATPSGWQTSPYAVTLSGTDDQPGTVRMRWRLGAGGAVNEVDSGTEITVSDLGVLDFQTQAVDVSDNASVWRSETLQIDTVDPTDATDPGPTVWYAAATTVDVAAVDITSGVDHVEWELDGGLTQSGPNGSDVAISGDGVHTLRTRAVDVAGNVSAWRDHTIRVDTVTPADTTAVPAGWQTSPLNVSVTGTDAHSGVNQVSWRVDGGTTSTTTSVPGSFTVSAEGVHTIETRVRDAAGHQTGWKSQTVRIDTTAPVNQTQTSNPAWQTADYSVLVTAADGGSGLAEVQWRIDAGPWLSGAFGSQANVTGTGDHTLETRAVDVAGNVSVARLDPVRIDRVTPTNTTAPAPGSPVGNPYQVAVTGTDAHAGVTGVEWQVDSGPVQSGASGAQATVSGHGSHTLKTRVIDGAGNTSVWRTDTIAIDAVTGDSTAPTDTTTAAPSGWRATPIAVTVAATDAGSGVAEVRWRIDGQPLESSLVDDPSFTIDEEGEHLLETQATDVAGNSSAWREQTFKVDLSVPVDATDIPAGWKDVDTFTLAASDAHSGLASIQYRIDGGPTQTGTPGQVVSVGTDGTHTVATRAIDNAGHATAFRTATLQVDRVDPVNTSAVPGSGWRAEPLELALTGTDDRSGIATMQWRVDGGAIHDGSTAVVVADGQHTLETRAVDAAGNTTTWRSDTVRIDATAPVNTTAEPPAGWRRTPYSVTVTGDDGAGSGTDKIERTIDGGAVSEDENASIAEEGVHTLRTRIVDNVGRASAWREDVIRIDATAPDAWIACDGGDGTWSRAAVTCSLGADGGSSGLTALTLARDGGAAEGVASGAASTVGDGAHTLVLAATDGAGNTGGAQATVYVDTTAPAATLTCAPEGSKHTCRADASDATSGLAALAYRVDGGDYTTVAPGGTFTVAKGKVDLRAVDVAGNEIVTAPVTLAASKGGTVKVTSVPVYLAGHTDSGSLVGALSAARSANGTVSVDLRPLAVGRGRFKVQIDIKAGKRSRRFTRTYRVGRDGTLPRIATSLANATARCTVRLTVSRRAGERWRRHAGTRLVLAK